MIFCEISNDPNSNSYAVIQRRINGETDFNKNCEEYAKGFGSLQGKRMHSCIPSTRTRTRTRRPIIDLLVSISLIVENELERTGTGT